jgi:hypothetical protein
LTDFVLFVLLPFPPFSQSVFLDLPLLKRSTVLKLFQNILLQVTLRPIHLPECALCAFKVSAGVWAVSETAHPSIPRLYNRGTAISKEASGN